MSNPSQSQKSDRGAGSSRRKFIRTASVGVVAGFAGCAGGSGDSGESGKGTASGNGATTGTAQNQLADKLRVLTRGGSYGQDQKEAFIDSFSNEFGVEVEWGKFGTDWDLISKQKAGGSSEVDVIQPTQSGGYVAVKDDLLEPIRLKNLDNWENVMEKFRNPKWDPGEQVHLAPFVFGGHGMVYNTEQYAPPNGSTGDPPKNWEDLFHTGTKGKVALISNPDLLVSIAASDRDDVDVETFGQNYKQNMQKVWERVKHYNKYVFQFFDSGSTMQQLLTNESAIAGLFWNGRTYNLRKDQGVPVRYEVPNDGAPFWMDHFAIAKGTKRRYTAEKFIDWTLRDDNTINFAKDIPYAPAKKISKSKMPTALRRNADLKEAENLEILDPQLVLDHRKEWAKKFQQIVRG